MSGANFWKRRTDCAVLILINDINILMKLKLLLLSLIANVSVEAQITFHKTFGGTGDDYGTSVQQTNDGGYIITGFTNGVDSGNADVYLIKTDSNGDTIWTRTFGGTNQGLGKFGTANCR